MLFQCNAPSQTGNDTLNASNQHNKIRNENYSNLCSDDRANEKLPHSNVIDLMEKQIEIIGFCCIGPESLTHFHFFTRVLRGTDKRPRKMWRIWLVQMSPQRI